MKGRGEIFHVGIDLGCFKTSVAATNGQRETCLSFVGYPKDAVSKRLLGNGALFGEEVLEHRLACEVVRPFERGYLKYGKNPSNGNAEELRKHKKAARELLQHAVDLSQPPKRARIYGVIGAPARASIYNKQALLEAADEVFDSVMIVSEPFAVAYGLGFLEDTLVVDIGGGTVDLARMHGSMPTAEDQITLTTAGDYLDEVFFDKIRKSHRNAQITINMARQIKERFSFIQGVDESVIVDLPVAGKPTRFDLTKELKSACEAVAGPIVEAIQELVATFDPEFQQRLRSRILLAGGGSQVRGLDRRIEEALIEYGGGAVRRVNEPVFAGSNGALKLATEMPEEFWQQVTETEDANAQADSETETGSKPETKSKSKAKSKAKASV